MTIASGAIAQASTKLRGGARRVLYVSIAGDVAIAAAKFVVAAMTGSSAMLTEGIHSVVDTGNELLLWFGAKRGQRAVDDWHPFGYGKATYVWSLIVALLVCSFGGGAAVYQGIMGLTAPPALTNPGWNYFVLGISAVFQGVSWRVTKHEVDLHRRADESLWRVLQRDVDVLVFTVFIGDTAGLAGIVIATLGVWTSHVFQLPYLDPAASVVIGLVLIASAALLARKSVRLLVGQSIDPIQLAQLRKIISDEPAVESVGRLLTMRLGDDRVLLIAAVRFQRGLDLNKVEIAIERLEHVIKHQQPSIHHLYLESGALKRAEKVSADVGAPT